jgi:hypothetical protein
MKFRQFVVQNVKLVMLSAKYRNTMDNYNYLKLLSVIDLKRGVFHKKLP